MLLHEIEKLYPYYQQLPFYKKCFFPFALRKLVRDYHLALSKKDNSQIISVGFTILLKVFLMPHSNLSRWLFPQLNPFLPNPLLNLNQNFVNRENLDALLKLFAFMASTRLFKEEQEDNPRKKFIDYRDLLSVDSLLALNELYTTGFLTTEHAQANFLAVLNHKSPWFIFWAFDELRATGLLIGEQAQANFQVIVEHRDPMDITLNFKKLHVTGLLSGEHAQVNRQAISAKQDLNTVVEALVTLHDLGLLSGENAQNNFKAVLAHKYPLIINEALKDLYAAGPIAYQQVQDNFQAIVSSHSSGDIVSSLKLLHAAGLLTGQMGQTNRQALVDSKAGISSDLMELSLSGLLTGHHAQANFQVILTHQNLGSVTATLKRLNKVEGFFLRADAQIIFNIAKSL